MGELGQLLAESFDVGELRLMASAVRVRLAAVWVAQFGAWLAAAGVKPFEIALVMGTETRKWETIDQKKRRRYGLEKTKPT